VIVCYKMAILFFYFNPPPKKNIINFGMQYLDEISRQDGVAAPRAWNRLPTQLKRLRLTSTFRCQLKTSLFQSAYRHRKQTDDCFVM